MENHVHYTPHPSAASGAKREKLHVIPYDQVPYQEITDAFIRVAEFGVKKYGTWNWSLGIPRVQVLGSLLRHAFAYLRGEDCDKETGLPHTDHIIWNAAVLVHSVHWRLEDGRRPEPHRAYKDPKPSAAPFLNLAQMGQIGQAEHEFAPVDQNLGI